RMRTLANFFRNRNGINQSMDLRNRAPMRLRRNVEVYLHTLDRRSLHLGDAHVDPIESEGRRQSRKPQAIETIVDERTDKHVSSDAAGRIEYGDLHSDNLIPETPVLILHAAPGMTSEHYEVAVVGGGPAGLSAALWAG